MYLVRIDTLQLEEFIEGQIPPYAILSHRWGSEELNFKEVFKNRIDKHKSGYKKLVEACRISAAYNVNYLWVDTCCIDKKSSAELSEAINSMFVWYKNAKVCLAFLEDVRTSPEIDNSFKDSVWFTRSWTLQELLAPKQVNFYDHDWIYFGNRKTKAPLIAEVTGIAEEILTDSDYPLWERCIAEKMSWAANRTATRSEDIAYSLMGIFDVNMPLLYGEGMKAFGRLQEEIISHTSDTTFLLWGLDDRSHVLLASSPYDFRKVRSLQQVSSWPIAAFDLANRGLEIDAHFVRWQYGVYGVRIAQDENNTIYLILLRKCPWSNALYRVGIETMKGGNLVWYVNRKMTVMHGTREQRLEDDILDDWIYCLPSTPEFVLYVRIEAIFSAQPAAGGDDVVWLYDEVEDFGRGMICSFSNPMKQSIAKIACRLRQGDPLLIDLSFDHDSNAVALIQTHRGRYSVLQVPDLLKHRREFDGGFFTTIGIMDKVDGNQFHFLRTREFVTVKISPELIMDDRPVWVSLIHPHRSQPKSHRWTCAISTQRPKHLPSDDPTTTELEDTTRAD